MHYFKYKKPILFYSESAYSFVVNENLTPCGTKRANESFGDTNMQNSFITTMYCNIFLNNTGQFILGPNHPPTYDQ